MCRGLRTSPTGTWPSDPRAQRVLRRARSSQRRPRRRSRRSDLARGQQTRPGTAYRMSHPVPAAGLPALLARGIAPVPVRRVIANQGSRSEGSRPHKMGERPRCSHLIVILTLPVCRGFHSGRPDDCSVGAGLSAFVRTNSGALRRDLAWSLGGGGQARPTGVVFPYNTCAARLSGCDGGIARRRGSKELSHVERCGSS